MFESGNGKLDKKLATIDFDISRMKKYYMHSVKKHLKAE